MRRNAKIIPLERAHAIRQQANKRSAAKKWNNRRWIAQTFAQRRPGLSLILWVGIGLSALIWTYIHMPPNLAGSSGFYRYCADAHARGVYNIPRHSPSYRPALDADNDGLACEPMPRQ